MKLPRVSEIVIEMRDDNEVLVQWPVRVDTDDPSTVSTTFSADPDVTEEEIRREAIRAALKGNDHGVAPTKVFDQDRVGKL